MATFKVVKDLILLDLVNLPEVPSIFEQSDEYLLDRAGLIFLHDFVADLTQPIGKDGREHVDYVPSQVVTEYTRYRLTEKLGKPISGIRYRSARTENGIGCVLFLTQEDLRVGICGTPARTEAGIDSGDSERVAAAESKTHADGDRWHRSHGVRSTLDNKS